MSQIIPFEFESHALRVNLDAAGQPWFVAADVLSTLSLDRKALERLDDDEKGVSSIHTPGGAQDMTAVNESGLYNLVLGSRKPEAKRFKRWITHEVLPSIRKTGSYTSAMSVAALPSPTQDRVSSLLLIGEAVAKVPGVKHGIAMAATLTCIHENTGLSIETMRRALPANDEPIAAMNPTKLGQQLGMAARSVNARLAAMGLQLRNDRDEWELTEAGQAWGEALPYSRNGHSGYQILWNPAVIDQMKEVA
ncbi:BRO family protein [Rhodoferax sp.]|uniref:BRO-N domain-containing protein n=1 Tax=Rhodoferax sp. TaxID=50421 RepID=UPI0026132E86|nr:BRO family protein [Rhodoferax sp.]MDD2810352.1 BRO family protein [Rhodoferax sp.]MDD4943673.1 BRO family protein [Rhodoferax sp.]